MTWTNRQVDTSSLFSCNRNNKKLVFLSIIPDTIRKYESTRWKSEKIIFYLHNLITFRSVLEIRLINYISVVIKLAPGDVTSCWNFFTIFPSSLIEPSSHLCWFFLSLFNSVNLCFPFFLSISEFAVNGEKFSPWRCPFNSFFLRWSSCLMIYWIHCPEFIIDCHGPLNILSRPENSPLTDHPKTTRTPTKNPELVLSPC